MATKRNAPKLKISLIYFGRYFYNESNTTIGVLYKKVADHMYRCDWSVAENALNDGYSVSIRPANAKEIAWACKMLEEMKSRK